MAEAAAQTHADIQVLRELARQVAQIAAKPVQNERRELWRQHNSLKRTRPPVLALGFPYWGEVYPDEQLKCRDPLYREFERTLLMRIYQDKLNDDTIVEPFVLVAPVRASLAGDERWGTPIRFVPGTEHRGAGIFDPPIKSEEDIEKLKPQPHRLDERASLEKWARMQDAFGDILPVYLNRAPLYSGWSADMSTDIARLIGLEQFMLYMAEKPEFVHRVQTILRDGVLAQHAAAEAAGDWRLFNAGNQAMCYCDSLEGPSAHFNPVKRQALWQFFASQETTLVSPAMFDEFVLQYQIPIMKHFGLIAYGCCEDLTRKIPLLKKLPNLRRIGVTPWANVARCAEQLGTRYVFSWRPSPTDAICSGFEPARLRRLLTENLAACRGCIVDITYKDIETINHRFADFVECVRITREISEKYA